MGPTNKPENTNSLEPFVRTDDDDSEDESITISPEAFNAIFRASSFETKEEEDDFVSKLDPPEVPLVPIPAHIVGMFVSLDKCWDALPCGHHCEDTVFNYLSGQQSCSPCRKRKDFKRPCGHSVTIYCGMKEPIDSCKVCEKIEDQRILNEWMDRLSIELKLDEVD